MTLSPQRPQGPLLHTRTCAYPHTRRPHHRIPAAEAAESRWALHGSVDAATEVATRRKLVRAARPLDALLGSLAEAGLHRSAGAFVHPGGEECDDSAFGGCIGVGGVVEAVQHGIVAWGVLLDSE